MFEPLHRVSFPVLSHMLAAKQDPARVLDRGVAVASTAAGVVLVAMGASAPELVPFVFGEQWREVGQIIPWICAALLVAGPLSVVAVGFLYASDAPSVVLRATILHSLALFAVAFPLLPLVGAQAIGMGSLAGAIVDAGDHGPRDPAALELARRSRACCRRSPSRPSPAPPGSRRRSWPAPACWPASRPASWRRSSTRRSSPPSAARCSRTRCG